MSHTLKVEIAHEGSHEPNGETFKDDLSKGLTKSLREAGLKRAEGAEPKITGYEQTSGVGTVYTVEIDAEPSAAAKSDDKADKK